MGQESGSVWPQTMRRILYYATVDKKLLRQFESASERIGGAKEWAGLQVSQVSLRSTVGE